MKFYRGTVTLTYVSAVTLALASFEQLQYECEEGEALAGLMTVNEIAIDRSEADRLAVEYGSDEEFFTLAVGAQDAQEE